MIDIHDRVIMLGHGSPLGLFSSDQFPDSPFCIVDGLMIGELYHIKEAFTCTFEAERDLIEEVLRYGYFTSPFTYVSSEKNR